MTDSEGAAVIVVGAIVGYVLVSWLFDRVSDGVRRSTTFDGRVSTVDAAATVEPPWYEVLQVSPSASDREVDVAYRKLAEEYRPGRVAALAPEFHQLAKLKSREIATAYERALAFRIGRFGNTDGGEVDLKRASGRPGSLDC